MLILGTQLSPSWHCRTALLLPSAASTQHQAGQHYPTVFQASMQATSQQLASPQRWWQNPAKIHHNRKSSGLADFKRRCV